MVSATARNVPPKSSSRAQLARSSGLIGTILARCHSWWLHLGKPLEARYHESTASFGCKTLLAPQNPARLQERKVCFVSEARTLGVVRGSLLPFLGGCACMCAVSSVTSDSLRPMDCSFPGSSVHRNLQARIMEWAAMPSSRGSSWPRDWICCLLQLLHSRLILHLWATLRKPFSESSSRNCGSFGHGFSLVIKQLTSSTWVAGARGVWGFSIYKAAQSRWLRILSVALEEGLRSLTLLKD